VWRKSPQGCSVGALVFFQTTAPMIKMPTSKNIAVHFLVIVVAPSFAGGDAGLRRAGINRE
jgi:hypothetical protein